MSCIECDGYLVDSATYGEMVCTSCGLVNEAHRAVGTDFSDLDPSKSRVNCVPTKARRPNMHCKQLRRAADNVFSSDIIETACEIYEHYAAKSSWKQRKALNHSGVLAATIYHACDVNRQPRQPEEVCALLPCLGAQLKNMRKMVKFLEVSAQSVKAGKRRLYLSNLPGVDYVPRYLRTLELRDKSVEKLCRRLYLEKRSCLENHRPGTIAACLITQAKRHLDLPISEQEIADMCSVTIPTINSLLNSLVTNTVKKMM